MAKPETNIITVSSAAFAAFGAENAVSSSDDVRARRTAFVARFIVLRESKRTKAHRIIERLAWDPDTDAESLAAIFRKIFQSNGDNLRPVDRDLKRALSHAARALNYFIPSYAARATNNFIDALEDYERSNGLLFGEGEAPRAGGWRLPVELRQERAQNSVQTIQLRP